jgi:hypothetical protein
MSILIQPGFSLLQKDLHMTWYVCVFICTLLTRLRPKALARHSKTDPTDTVALCFGYPETQCLRAVGKLSSPLSRGHDGLYFKLPSPFIL